MSFVSLQKTYNLNAIEQGTGVNTKHYGVDDGGGWKYKGEPPFFAKTPEYSTEGQSFAAGKTIQSLIHCCTPNPTTTTRHHTVPPYGSSPDVSDPTDCTTVVVEAPCPSYGYMNCVGCPVGYIWEYKTDGTLTHVYKRGSVQHPSWNGGTVNTATDAMLTAEGAAGFYSSTPTTGSPVSAQYSLRLENLSPQQHYTVAVMFVHRRIEGGSSGVDPTCFHVFKTHKFTATECIKVISDESFPNAPQSGYFVNLRKIYIEKSCAD